MIFVIQAQKQHQQTAADKVPSNLHVMRGAISACRNCDKSRLPSMFARRLSSAYTVYFNFNQVAVARHFATATAGPREREIFERLSNFLHPTHLEVLNTSHGRRSDESHFKVVVVSDKFEGVPLIKRHRMVTSAITDDTGNLDFHSLEIASAVTPDQWSSDSVVRPSPKCKGNRK